MLITLEIPDELSAAPCGDPARIAMEAVAARAYESGVFSEEQVRRMLGLASCWEARDVLSRYRVWPGSTVEDAVGDVESLKTIRAVQW